MASIIIYDIYQAYVQPFRTDLKLGQCIICGRYMREVTARLNGEPADYELCSCPSAHSCDGCKADNEARARSKSLVKPHFACPVHKDFKSYQVIIYPRALRCFNGKTNGNYVYITGMLAQLQELVHRAVYLLQHPSLLVLLGRQSQPDVDLLLHGHFDRVLRRPHRLVHPVGQGHPGRDECGCRRQEKSSERSDLYE